MKFPAASSGASYWNVFSSSSQVTGILLWQIKPIHLQLFTSTNLTFAVMLYL
jgi:hypothetical protein